MGVDYSDPQTPPRVLVAHGAKFACRYASWLGNPKNLTPNEVAPLTMAGIAIVSVFETTAMRAAEGFQAGHDDALTGYAQHYALGMPADAPMYFTVDFDMQAVQEASVMEYFHGVGSVASTHPVGIYGGLRACEAVHGAGLAEFVWQTYAWSGGIWYSTTHLRQVQNGLNWDGWQVDLDEAWAADYGQWWATGQPVPSPPPPGQNWMDRIMQTLPTIQIGAIDASGGFWAVHRIQAILNDVIGINVGAVDGDFGPHTHQGVLDYQARYGLAQDGIVGPHTWARLLADQSL
jgi:Domain of unknown function (DUF1906)/Putative peptidoglycan binding domain